MTPQESKNLRVFAWNQPGFEEVLNVLHDKLARSKDDGLPIENFKQCRKQCEELLLEEHQEGGGGVEVCRKRSEIVDWLVRELFEFVAQKLTVRCPLQGICIVAFGGYGRRELNPFSDVDIMFLTDSKAISSNELKEVVRRFTTALWDIGFKVGHSVRSISQAIEQANADLKTKTSMIECRYLHGDRRVYTDFRSQFERYCVKGKEVEYLKWRVENLKQMHEHHGGTVFVQEPNIKCGVGGLRDYQNLLWVSFMKERVLSTAKLVELSILREEERRQLEEAHDFLLRVRTQMHYSNGRPIDNLTLRLQGQVATAFDYPQKNMVRRCEAFMRDYYQHSRNIHIITDTAIERLNLTPLLRRRSLLLIFRRPPSGENFDGLIAKDGMLYPQSRQIFEEDPARLMRVFQHAQVKQLRLSVELKDLIRRRLHLVDKTFQYARVNREVFLSILSRKGLVGRILREMHETEFLGRYLPEFGALTCLVQHEFFHRYTADEHTLVCIEKLDSLLFTKEPRFAGYRTIFQKIDDPSILYLALLLHDTGKALNRRHHEEASTELAFRVARRMQLSPDRRKLLLNLVDSHYLLSKTAQSRNLDDPVTITEFASIIRDRQTLDALMLITLADGMGTSADKWSDWKESLVWQLYHETAHYLEEGPTAFERKQKDRLELKRRVAEWLSPGLKEEIDALFDLMPERYFQMFEDTEIREHIRLFHDFFGMLDMPNSNPLSAMIRWTDRPEQGHSEVWIVGWDRPAFLERIAGCFVASNMNILSADVFTRGDHVALDIFRVCNMRRSAITNPKEKETFQRILEKSLTTENFDFEPHFQKSTGLKFYRLSQEIDMPSKVSIENRAHPNYTLIEIQTPDRPGLLYDLLHSLGKAGISIELSRITTEMDVAIDAFYVLGPDRQKITSPELLERVRSLLQEVISKNSLLTGQQES